MAKGQRIETPGTQRTISNFFAPKNKITSTTKPSSTLTSLSSPPLSIQSKRPSIDNLNVSATKKRKILSKHDDVDVDVDDDNDDSLDDILDDKVDINVDDVQNETQKLTESTTNKSLSKINKAHRASKFLFNSSSVVDPEEETPEAKQRKKDLHRRFVQKLGNPDALADIRRRNHIIKEEDIIDSTENDDGQIHIDEEEEEEEQQVRTKKMISNSKSAKGGLTPMVRQYLEIKQKHLDKVIIYQVGYKYLFYGEDARIASKVLSIVCIPGKFRFDNHPSESHLDRLASASIPVPRLHVHVKRLVAAGHKVGVVQQLETAALKAASSDRGKVFKRELTNVYTQSTYVDELADSEGLDSSLAGYAICLAESNIKVDDDEKVRIGLIAVQPATGSILYDEFDDGFMRGELETRLLHISPCEYVLVGSLSNATQKLLKHVASSKNATGGLKARIENVDSIIPVEAANIVSNFYSNQARNNEDQADHSDVLEKIHNLPKLVTICLSTLIKHLEEFGLENVFDLTNNFESFALRTHMALNSNTLTSLEVYQSSVDGSEKQSLFWTIDRTRTRFGKRLLRSWVGRPLLVKAEVEQRLDAVEELKNDTSLLSVIRRLLLFVKGDLEKTLIRIYYGRASRPEVLHFLQSLQKVALEKTPNVETNLLKEHLTYFPQIQEQIIKFLDQINLDAALKDTKYTFFVESDKTDAITNHKCSIAAIENDLDEQLVDIAKQLKRNKMEFNSVAGVDYLIEVENNTNAIKLVPASWIKISHTKKLSRFHTPAVLKLMRERDQCKERLSNACDEAFSRFMQEISTNYESLRNCVQSLASLDCLCSLAEIASLPNYCKPKFTSSNTISVSQVRHPIVEQVLLDTYVANNVTLSGDTHTPNPSALLITGPNMGGKSSFVRSVALVCIMAQIGCFVPAESASLPLLDAVYTRMGALDNMIRGESTFMVELGETSDILRQASNRSLVILDELGRGTSTHDGVAIAEAVLRELVNQNIMTMFITHYQDLSRIKLDGLKNVHVKFAEIGEGITFLYEIGEGVAHRSYGLNVARLAHIPKNIIEVALVKSEELESNMNKRKISNLCRLLSSACNNKDSSIFPKLIMGAEHMDLL